LAIETVCIIGGGHLGGAIAEGLIRSGGMPPKNVTVTRRRPELLRHLADMGVRVSLNNKEAAAEAQAVLLCVKPHQAAAAIEDVKPALDSRQTVVSTVAGLTLKTLSEALPANPIFRAMPNTAVAIADSMTCLSTPPAFAGQIGPVQELFGKIGKTLVIGEELMDAATVLGACGIAYALRFLRAMTQGGIEIGFSSEMAQFVAAQTLHGAASLVVETGNHPEQEIDKVTTPMGITIAGLNEMEHNGFSSALIKGVGMSFRRIAKKTAQ